jgi:PAS domain S-box-containing protein
MKIIEHTQEYEKIIRLLKEYPSGLSIKEISHNLGLNRNLVSKLLDILHLRGKLDIRYVGKAKIFFISNRIPFNKFLTLHWDYFIAINRDSEVIFANEPLCLYLAVSMGQMTGKKINTLSFPPLLDNNANSDIKIAIGGHESIKDIEFVFRNKKHFFSLSYLPTVFENGSIGVCIGMHDKTKIMDLEKTVDYLTSVIELVTYGSGVYVIQFYKNGRIHYADGALCAMAGMTKEELYKKSFLEFIPEKERNAVMALLNAMTPEHPIGEAEQQTFCKDGELRWQKWKYRGIIHNGKITELQAVGFDITDYKTHETQLRKNYEDLEQAHKMLQKEMGEQKCLERDNYLSGFVIDNAYDMIVWFDDSGNIRFANKKMMKHLGCNRSLVDKLTFFDIFTDSGPDDWEYIWGRIQAELGVFHEARLAGHSGKPVDAEVVLNYISNEDHQFCCCVIRDITLHENMQKIRSRRVK